MSSWALHCRSNPGGTVRMLLNQRLRQKGPARGFYKRMQMHSLTRDPRGSLGMPQSVSVNCLRSSGYSIEVLLKRMLIGLGVFVNLNGGGSDIGFGRNKNQKSSNLQFDFLKKNCICSGCK